MSTYTLSNPTVAKLISGILNADSKELDFIVFYWQGLETLSVQPWTTSGDGSWALRVSLSLLARPREEAYFPFPWDADDKPTVTQAIDLLRDIQVIYKKA